MIVIHTGNARHCCRSDASNRGFPRGLGCCYVGRACLCDIVQFEGECDRHAEIARLEKMGHGFRSQNPSKLIRAFKAPSSNKDLNKTPLMERFFREFRGTK
jgi:hypothetical protein